MAKGQKRSNHEAKKPKQPKVKVIAARSPFAAARAQGAPAPGKTPVPAKKS
jgi:hypothetical protein